MKDFIWWPHAHVIAYDKAYRQNAYNNYSDTGNAYCNTDSTYVAWYVGCLVVAYWTSDGEVTGSTPSQSTAR